jgi:hypothetical protein
MPILREKKGIWICARKNWWLGRHGPWRIEVKAMKKDVEGIAFYFLISKWDIIEKH